MIPRILAAALRQGLGQEEALATLRRENLALQDEEAALLDQAGYPPDALEETPYCPLCNDRGWRGAAMCDCLKDLCRQEQIAELSSPYRANFRVSNRERMLAAVS